METPEKISSLSLECDCTSITVNQWEKLMEGATRANKRLIDKHVLDYYPEQFDILRFYNPYNYFKTNTHLIVVHSAIEYFFKYTL